MSLDGMIVVATRVVAEGPAGLLAGVTARKTYLRDVATAAASSRADKS